MRTKTKRYYPYLTTLLFATIFTAYVGNQGTIAMLPLTMTHAPLAVPQRTTMPAQIMDRQQLAEYQALLPAYSASVIGVRHQRGKTFDQIADRQMLAEYQATLTIGQLETAVSK